MEQKNRQTLSHVIAARKKVMECLGNELTIPDKLEVLCGALGGMIGLHVKSDYRPKALRDVDKRVRAYARGTGDAADRKKREAEQQASIERKDDEIVRI